MSQAHHSLHHQAAIQPSWAQRFMRWLSRCWQTQCARAESPTRSVPYY